MSSEWANLPDLILSEIACCMSVYDDFVNFGAVCKAWQRVYSMKKPPLSPRCPWLLLAEEKEQKNHTRVFFNVFDNKVYNFKLPELAGRKCIGTSFGWLLSVGIDFQMNLFHPLTKHQPGYKAWIDIKCDSRRFYDITLYKGKFYAVNNRGKVFVCHIDGDIVFTECITFCKEPEDYIQKYLVESSGDLLLVSRIREGPLEADEFINDDFEDDIEDVNIHEDESEEEQEQDQEQVREVGQEIIYEIPYVTTGFKILKLESSSEVKSKNEYDWVNVDSLGDQALFVGDNSSMSLSASSFNGCKANCIYFTDDNVDCYPNCLNGGGYDMGVFSMEDGTIKQHYKGKSLSSFAPPVWFI
nr:f-box protein [Quercus suber]